MSDGFFAFAPARWLQRLLNLVAGQCPHRPPHEKRCCELTAHDAAILRDIGVDPQEFFAARAAGGRPAVLTARRAAPVHGTASPRPRTGPKGEPIWLV